MEGIEPKCTECVHFIEEKGAKCEAFPEGIPEAIWVGSYDHTKPFFGDGGIRYEPIRSKQAAV